MINIAQTKANNPSVRIGSMILIIGRTSHTCIDIIIFILHTYPSAPKWGTFDIGAPSAPNGALNGALNGGTKLDIFQKKFSLMFVRVIHLKVNLGQLMKIFIFFF